MSKKYLCCECGFIGKPEIYLEKKPYKDHFMDWFTGPPRAGSLASYFRTTKKNKRCPKCGSTQITSDMPQDK